ncbi:B12-binding domain-containing radical SAM protein [Dehalogenimonas etheniformans]|uniref:Radical SAM protein n=1 Tax=Dehalogenimonas etheniformans TaxID=1536648 RepID=A0A2P5P8R3_9CHLR|nr:radical SAM protein [Dehalogenimonas etheniformans]PPD58688.1 radical SAM protein [Dehalogenimonas etheniformans]QNT76543.1 B12-binding domain-containing radical SAM protein [Dehalogenimonas etheniformans]
MKILLVVPSRSYGNMPRYTKFPDEMLSIGGMLESLGHKVKFIDCNLEKKRPADFIEFTPELVGFSVATGPNIADALSQSAEFKKLLPDVKTVWGFRHASAYPDQVLAESCVDYAVIGAGEFTIAELADYLEKGSPQLSSIKGLAWKDCSGKAIINEVRTFMSDMDGLPDPAWHLINVNRYSDVTLNTSRGCPYKCTFCSDTTFWGGQMCDLSAARIVSQMEKLHKDFGIHHIYFSGERFVINRKRLREFCQLVIAKKWKLTWNAPVSGGIDEETVKLMAKSGCTSVLLEAESGSQRMLDFIHKDITVPEMENTFWNLVKAKIRTSVYIIYGFPTETIEDFKATHEMLGRLDDPYYMYNRFVPFPGSVLFDYCVKHNLVKLPERLEGWPEYLMRFSNQVNISEVPEEMMSEAAAHWRATYAVQRFRFTLKHNPAYFWTAVTDPGKFFRELWELAKFHIQVNGFYKIVKKKLSTPENKPVTPSCAKAQAR